MKIQKLCFSLLLTLFIAHVCAGAMFDFKYFQEQANNGDPVGYFFLAVFNYEGTKGVKKDFNKAYEFYLKGSELGDLDCLYGVGLGQIKGEGTEKNIEAGMEKVRLAALKGHPLAISVYGGHLFEKGEKVKATALLDLAQSRMDLFGINVKSQFVKIRNTFKSKLSKEEVSQVEKNSFKFHQNIPIYVTKLQRTDLPPGMPAFSKEEGEEMMKKVIPLVEKATGKRFKNRPELVMASRSEVATELAIELNTQFQNLTPGNSRLENIELAENAAISASYSLFGKYGIRSKKLYILPRNMIPLMRNVGIPEKMLKPLVEVVIAHELTHALQDQHANISDKVFSVSNSDEMVALNAVMEGHAVFMQDSVGTAMGYDKEIIEFANIFSTGQGKGEKSVKNILNVKSAISSAGYVMGKKFVDHLVRVYGRKYLWNVLITPPKTSAVIASPENYRSKQAESLDLGKVFKGLGSFITDEKLLETSQAIGILNLKAAYPNMNEKKRDKLISAMKQAHVYIFQKAEKSPPNSITIYWFKDKNITIDFLDSLEFMARINLGLLSQQPGVLIKDIEFSSISAPEATKNHLIAFGVYDKKERLLSRASIVRLIYDDLVVEISNGDLNLPAPRIAEIAGEVYKRFSALKNNKGKPNDDTKDLMKQAVKFYKKQLFSEANRKLSQIFLRDPYYGQARFLAAIIAAKQKDYPAAWKHATIAQKKSPDNIKIKKFVQKLRKVAPPNSLKQK